MNLSAMNKPSANSLGISNNEAAAPAGSLSRLSSTSLSGADFASFLHNQVQALKAPQRQDSATDHGKLPQTRTDRAATGNDQPDDKVRAKSGKSNEQAQSNHPTQRPVKNEKDASTDSTPAQDLANAQLSDTLTQAAPTDASKDQLPATDNRWQENAVSDQPGSLTTIALSDSLQIITAAQAAPSEKSVADFALAMGLDPGQVKALFGPDSAAAASANAKTALSTQDMLGLNTMPSFTPLDNGAVNGTDGLPGSMQAQALNAPVSSADFQALQQVAAKSDSKPDMDLLSKMENVQLQTGNAQAMQTAAAPPPSTLSVLSMMDATLRTGDIESLKKEFDSFYVGTESDSSALSLPASPAGAPASRPAHQAGLPAAQVFADRPDLAKTYENLSNKLSTELAARMHEKLNAGEWKMKFALKPASLGLVDVQLEMRDGKLSAQFQSDTPLTQELIQNGSQRLKDALADLGLNNASVFVGQGQSQSAGQSGQQAQSGLPVPRGENREKLTEQPGAKIAEISAPKRNKRSQFDSYA